MLEDYFGLVELAFSFGVIVALCVWQLVSIEKTRKRLEREDDDTSR